MSKKFVERGSARIGICLIFMIVSSNVVAQTRAWTLSSSVQQVLQVAPERVAAEAEVKMRQGDIRQAGLWPNPVVELGASNAMGKDDGQGGTDLNQFSISQLLPLSGRLGQQRKRAKANLIQAKANVSRQGLLLEYEAARVFHDLQFNYARTRLAEQRLESANEFQRIGRRREQAGDLSLLERLRLDLVRESAVQLIASAEGRFSESLSDFKTLLNIAEVDPQLKPLTQFPHLPELTHLKTYFDAHPALLVARQGVAAAQHDVAIARARRFVDPELWLQRQRDVLGNRRQNVTAFGVAVTLPLWNRSKGTIDAAQANRQKVQFEVAALERQLGNRLRLSHLHLSHLIKWGEQYRNKVLEPAEEIFQLSRKGFAAGQVAILNLVDAVDTYFNARVRYLELLQEAWLEAAALRRAAGHSVLINQGTTP